MNRDELLDKLAMELVAWPERASMPPPNAPGIWSCHHVWRCQAKGDESLIFPEDWLQRRTELINRPDDSEAPEWAEWLAQCGCDGAWEWYEGDVVLSEERGYWKHSGRGAPASSGSLPNGHDWRKTLTRINRQPTEAQQHQIDAARLDAQLRSAMAACKFTPQEDEAFQALDEKLKRQQSSAPRILNAASQHLQDRAATYDKPEGERSMAATVDAFRATTGITLTEEQGWHFMALLKLVRSQQGDLRLDSYEDGAAYFALAGESAAKERRK